MPKDPGMPKLVGIRQKTARYKPAVVRATLPRLPKAGSSTWGLSESKVYDATAQQKYATDLETVRRDGRKKMTNSMIKVLDEYHESNSGNLSMDNNPNHYHPTALNGDEDDENVLNIAHALLASMGNEHHVQRVQQTWSSRLLGQQDGWAPQITVMRNAFLEYKNSNPTSYPSRDSDDSNATSSLPVTLIDIYEGEHKGSVPVLPGDAFPAVSLMRAGYISPSPIMPTVAFSVRTIELFHGLQRTMSSYSAQSFARLMCHMLRVPYRIYLRTQISLVFDVYYQIYEGSVLIIKVALGHDAPDYRLQHSCPCCHLKLKDEPQQKIRLFVTGDGNSSLSRLAHRNEVDRRIFKSDYRLSREYVDQFKDEVKYRKNRDDVAGDGYDITDQCMGWENARSSEKELSTALDETGIYAVVCQHGIIQIFTDMIKSGELMKNPLACVHKLIVTFGPDIMFGYDIACSFLATLRKSSLGSLVQDNNFQVATGAFHGAAHHRTCQLSHIIGMKDGAGLEPLEECEQCFSASNAVAIVTRHSSAYHRGLRIDMHFQRWDEEKFLALPTYLTTKYKTAITTLGESEQTLERLGKAPYCLDADSCCPGFLESEKAYLKALTTEPPLERSNIEYLDALERYYAAESAISSLSSTMVLSTPTTIHSQHGYGTDASYTLKREAERYHAFELRDNALQRVAYLERGGSFNPATRWTSASADWITASALRNDRDANRLLDEIERGGISRTLELEKVALPGTNYKAREQIMKALSRRSTTLASNMEKYNKLAPKMIPPKALLIWADVTSLDFVADMHIIRGRADVRTKDWANPVNREATRAWLKRKRAKEELISVGLQLRRLWTYMQDEEVHLVAMLQRSADQPIVEFMIQFVELRTRTFHQMRQRLLQLESLPGFCLLRGAEMYGATGMHTVDRPSYEGYEDDGEDQDIFEGMVDKLAGALDRVL